MRDSFGVAESYEFAGGSDSEDILHALTKLAPDCTGCPGKRLYICVQACCTGAEPFCLQCDDELHFLHRKNELRMLFVERKTIPTFSQNKRQLFRELQEYIEERKKKVEGWVLQSLQEIMHDEQAIREKQQRLRSSQASVDYGVKLIASCEKLLMSIKLSECRMTTDWQQIMYALVERAVEGNRINQQDKQQFNEALLNINLHEQRVEDSIQKDCFLEAPTSWEELPLVRVENVYWLNGDLTDLLRQFEKKPNLEALVRETHIERFIGRNDKQLYWQTTDSIHRSRILHSGYSSCRGSRLLLVGGEGVTHDIALKNTVTELYYDQERTELTILPSRLKSLTVSGELKMIPRLPESLERLKLMLTDAIARESGLSFSTWNCPLIEKLSCLRNLKYLTVNCCHLSSRQIKQVIEYALGKRLRMLVLLTIEVALCEYTVRKVESIFSHVYPQLEQHYLKYKRRLQQVMLIHRTAFRSNRRVCQDLLHFASSRDDAEDY